MGLHREIRRFKQLGLSGFVAHHYRTSYFASMAQSMGMLENWREVRSTYRAAPTPATMRFRRGFRLDYTPDDDPLTLAREVIVDRCYRRHIREPAAGVIIDIGANIGLVTLDWAVRIPGVLIHAYEPDPRTFATLAANVASNKLSSRVRLYNEAVGAQAGSMSLYRIGNSSLTTSFAVGKSEPITVPVVNLKDVVDRALRDGPIGLVKMDTEGAEVAILEAASANTFAACSQFALEYHDLYCPGARERCQKALEQAGFLCIDCPLPTNRVTGASGLLYAILRTLP